ncbi:unnamed protein product, partial [Polarella glacialis]
VRILDLPPEWAGFDAQQLCSTYGKVLELTLVSKLSVGSSGVFDIRFADEAAAAEAAKALNGLQVPARNGLKTIRCLYLDGLRPRRSKWETAGEAAFAKSTEEPSGGAASGADASGAEEQPQEELVEPEQVEQGDPTPCDEANAPWQRHRRKRTAKGAAKSAWSEEQLQQVRSEITARLGAIGNWKPGERTQKKLAAIGDKIVADVTGASTEDAKERMVAMFAWLAKTLGKERAQDRDGVLLFGVLLWECAMPEAGGSYDLLVAAARAAGVSVSHKLVYRQVLGADGLKGMVAGEAVLAGEELACIPGQFFLSRGSLREAVGPAFFEAAAATEPVMPDSVTAACLAVLFSKSLAGFDEQQQQQQQPRQQQPAMGSIEAVWAWHCAVLLDQSFDAHPYVRAIANPELTGALLQPSCLSARTLAYANQIIDDASAIMQGSPGKLLASVVPGPVCFHAYLCIISRGFENGALVPIADCFNHSADPGVAWDIDSLGNMVLTAARNHSKGEELSISYGEKSNPLLFREYGFTLPGSQEPCWEYVLQGDEEQLEKVMGEHQFDLAGFLPEEMLRLSSQELDDSLLEALRASSGNGQAAAARLRQLCCICLEPYLRDGLLQGSLAALRQRRAVGGASCGGGAWDWEVRGENEEEEEQQEEQQQEEQQQQQKQQQQQQQKQQQDKQEESASDARQIQRRSFSQACVRVKMSEYLCLTAHVEALDCAAGLLQEDQCLAEAAAMRHALMNALESWLAQRLHQFQLSQAVSGATSPKAFFASSGSRCDGGGEDEDAFDQTESEYEEEYFGEYASSGEETTDGIFAEVHTNSVMTKGKNRRGNANAVPGGKDKEGSQGYYEDDDITLDELVRRERIQGVQDYDSNYEKHILKKGSKFKMLHDDEDEAYGLGNYESQDRKVDAKKWAEKHLKQEKQEKGRIQVNLEKCTFCMESKKFQRKEAMMSVAPHVYLCLDAFNRCIFPNQVCIVPQEHCNATTELEEAAAAEVRNYQKCLVRFFEEQDPPQAIIFVETAIHRVSRDK